jgi:hypothetical protein
VSPQAEKEEEKEEEEEELGLGRRRVDWDEERDGTTGSWTNAEREKLSQTHEGSLARSAVGRAGLR